jgi:hypothetical protein
MQEIIGRRGRHAGDRRAASSSADVEKVVSGGGSAECRYSLSCEVGVAVVFVGP